MKTIVSFKPDFVFVGLTETLSRVDHIARDICLKQKIKCGALQDYWGYLGNFNKFNYPDYFYVFDDEALKLSALNSEGSINCLAVGSPKHEAYKYNIKKWSKRSLLVSDNDFNVLYVGQPTDIDGIFENFSIFLDSISQIHISVKIFLSHIHRISNTRTYMKMHLKKIHTLS